MVGARLGLGVGLGFRVESHSNEGIELMQNPVPLTEAF